jgi:hypothetical protein
MSLTYSVTRDLRRTRRNERAEPAQKCEELGRVRDMNTWTARSRVRWRRIERGSERGVTHDLSVARLAVVEHEGEFASWQDERRDVDRLSVPAILLFASLFHDDQGRLP